MSWCENFAERQLCGNCPSTTFPNQEISDISVFYTVNEDKEYALSNNAPTIIATAQPSSTPHTIANIVFKFIELSFSVLLSFLSFSSNIVGFFPVGVVCSVVIALTITKKLCRNFF